MNDEPKKPFTIKACPLDSDEEVEIDVDALEAFFAPKFKEAAERLKASDPGPWDGDTVSKPPMRFVGRLKP